MNFNLAFQMLLILSSLAILGLVFRKLPVVAGLPLVSEKGFEVTEIPVVHEPRRFGKSKYGFSKVFKDIPDMFTILFLTKYAKRPLHFFGRLGIYQWTIAILIGMEQIIKALIIK